MSSQDTPYRVGQRKSSLIELYIPKKHIKHIENVSNLSLILSMIFIIYSMVNVGLYYFTGECIRDNVDVIISMISLATPVVFAGYIFFTEKYIYHADKIAPSQSHNNNPNLKPKPTN